MSLDLPSQLSTHESERDFVKRTHALVRDERFSEAEAPLVAWLSRQRDPVARAALELSLDRLSIIDWDQMDGWLARPVYGSDRLPDAVGLDLSNYAEVPSSEPSVEVGLYVERVSRTFPFSTATRDEFQEACAGFPVPWQGAFADSHGMRVSGFAPLNALLLERRRGGGDPRNCADELATNVAASLLMGIRFHELVAHLLRSRGLCQRVPVIVDGHGENYVACSTYFPERIVPFEAREEAGPSKDRARFESGLFDAAFFEQNLRHVAGRRRGPLVDKGVNLLAGFLADYVDRKLGGRRRS